MLPITTGLHPLPFRSEPYLADFVSDGKAQPVLKARTHERALVEQDGRQVTHEQGVDIKLLAQALYGNKVQAEIELGHVEDLRRQGPACRVRSAQIVRLLPDALLGEEGRSEFARIDHGCRDRLFSRKGIPPERELADNLQNSLERLAQLKGGQFDQAFKQQVIEDHEKAIALFQKQAKQGTDMELKAFAEKHLPHLREHLETARALPISSDTKGPPADSVNSILQNPASRINIPR